MVLHKWSSNSPELLNSSSSPDVEHSFSAESELSVKTLGISWKPLQDCFVFKVSILNSSEVAYGAVVYLQCFYQTDRAKVTILASKSHVAPIRVISIPRQELCACVLLAQLAQKIRSGIKLEISDIVLHTDSTITLAWLKAPANQLKTFIANRVSKIDGKVIKETPSDTWQTEKITVGSDAEENIDNENYIKNMEENPSLLQKPSFESILEEQMPEE
ncbi:uncharacterized protein TNCT_288381 [Trichonephila clavata]|uniref:Uncharacterized protein n=1 Tax=Trichonephila clavata TaxID=2740835 RepID=A0A8X6IYD4_TRICU|nr:uncharacterized protein TNCT_288381 [Trichonephila clavata]